MARTSHGFQIEDYLGTSRVLGFTMLVAAIDVILITASATLTAFLYNMAAALLGGVEVTLAEDEHCRVDFAPAPGPERFASGLRSSGAPSGQRSATRAYSSDG